MNPALLYRRSVVELIRFQFLYLYLINMTKYAERVNNVTCNVN
jgi:hypothetical protein